MAKILEKLHISFKIADFLCEEVTGKCEWCSHPQCSGPNCCILCVCFSNADFPSDPVKLLLLQRKEQNKTV